MLCHEYRSCLQLRTHTPHVTLLLPLSVALISEEQLNFT